MSNSRNPAVILYDANGIAMAVEDGVAIPASTRSQLWSGREKTTDLAQQARMIPDASDGDLKRLMVEADLAPGAEVIITSPVTATSLVAQQLTDDGLISGSPDMNIDGSGAPVEFTFPADATDDIILSELRIVVSGPKTFKLDGGSIGENGSALANGVTIEVTVNGGLNVVLETITINEDFFRFASTTGLNTLYAQGGANELIVSSFIFGGRQVLEGGSGDEVKVTVQDDLLPGGSPKILHFTGTFYGRKEA